MASDYELERLQTKLADVTAKRDHLQALIDALAETVQGSGEPMELWHGMLNSGPEGYHIEWTPDCTHLDASDEYCDEYCYDCPQNREQSVFGETLTAALEQLAERRKEAATNDHD